MDFSLSEVQDMLADSIDKFVVNDYDFDSRQKYVASKHGYSGAVWQTFAELGWTSVPFSEADGGIDGGLVDLMVVMERLGRGLVVEPYLANVVLAGGALKRAANAEQKQRWLSPMISGELQATLAFLEPQSRYEIANIKTVAVPTSSGWTLSGRKAYVLNGGTADIIIVPALIESDDASPAQVSLFVVDGGADGLAISSYETVDGLQAAELTLQDVAIDADAMIGSPEEGLRVLQQAVNDATFAVCAEAVGIMSVLTEKTVDYAKSRVQFGVPISSFQALQHRMVEMYTACEQSRSLLMWAAMTGQDDDERATQQAMHALKYQINTAGTRVAEEAVQIHGGMGVTWELDVAHYFKRLTAICLIFGNADWHLDRLAE